MDRSPGQVEMKQPAFAHHGGLETEDAPEPPALAARRIATIEQQLSSLHAGHPQPEDTIHPLHHEGSLARRPPGLQELSALPLIPLPWAAEEPESSEFAVECVLEEGGMGVLHVAHQRSLRRDVVIKRLKPSLLDPIRIASLLREARFTGVLEHPNTIPIHALGRDQTGQPLLVMKRIDGTNWRELLQDPEHPQSPPGVRSPLAWHIEVLMQICNAVHFAHSKGILHRDIKPQNVMVGQFGEVYLLDWGIALEKEPAADHEARGRLVGTPAYMAPEMLDGDSSKLDERTDVYLLGATLYELLTGAPPHQGETLAEVLRSVALCAPPPLDDRVPPELASICRRAMDADPNGRFESASAFRHALDQYLQHRASVEWSQQASQRLDELDKARASDDSTAVYRLFYECRFGCQQALREWPDNPYAPQTLEAALRSMFGYEIERQNTHAAAALLGELDHMDLEPKESQPLHAELAQLREAQRQSALDAQRLRDLERQFDRQVGLKERRRLLKVVLTTLGLMLPALFVLGIFGIKPTHPRYRLLIPVVWLSIYGLVLWSQRHTLLSNRINRTIALFIVFSGVALICSRWASLQWKIPLYFSEYSELLLFALLSACVALTTHRGALWLVLISLCGMAAMLWLRAFSSLIFLASIFLGFSVLVVLMRKEPTPPPASDAPPT